MVKAELLGTVRCPPTGPAEVSALLLPTWDQSKPMASSLQGLVGPGHVTSPILASAELHKAVCVMTFARFLFLML